MRISSSMWKLKHQVRRNPVILLIPALLASAGLIFILIKLFTWTAQLSSSVLWMLSGLANGLWIGWMLWGKGRRGRTYKK
ncbi:MAG: hypothetical protein WCC10_15560 [Tumebacillaceae bacterium]